MNMHTIITRTKQLSKSLVLVISVAVLLFSASWTRDVYALPSACEGIEDRQQQLLCVERLYQRDNISFLEPNACTPGSSSTTATTGTQTTPGALFVLGDSIGVGLTPALQGSLTSSEGWSVSGNSVAGRRLSEGIAIAQSPPAELTNARHILVVLGTNPDSENSSSGISAMITALKAANASAKIYWLKVNVTRSDLTAGATAFNSALSENSALTVLENTASLSGDQVHPSDYTALGSQVASAVRTSQSPTSTTPTVSGCTPCTGEGGGVPTGSNNQERAFRFFITKGMAPNQAAGFVGNLMAESGPNIDPTAVNPSSGAYGVAQWLGSRLTGLNSYASQNGGNREDFDIQMNYLWDVDIPAQINGGFPDIGRVTQNNPSMSVEEATEIILLEFERPGVGERKLEQRIGWARGVLQLYGNGTGGSSTTGCAGSESGRVIDGFVLYNQYDEKWANKPYGSSTIAVAGCGPSSIAMVVATLTGDRSVTPETVAARYGEEYYVPGEGSSWGLMENAPSDYGLTSQNIGTDIEAAKAAIRNGALVIASGKGAKPFTSGGHILVLRGVTDDGKILIGDSGHRDTSETPHEQSALTASIVNMWVVSK